MCADEAVRSMAAASCSRATEEGFFIGSCFFDHVKCISADQEVEIGCVEMVRAHEDQAVCLLSEHQQATVSPSSPAGLTPVLSGMVGVNVCRSWCRSPIKQSVESAWFGDITNTAWRVCASGPVTSAARLHRRPNKGRLRHPDDGVMEPCPALVYRARRSVIMTRLLIGNTRALRSAWWSTRTKARSRWAGG